MHRTEIKTSSLPRLVAAGILVMIGVANLYRGDSTGGVIFLGSGGLLACAIYVIKISSTSAIVIDSSKRSIGLIKWFFGRERIRYISVLDVSSIDLSVVGGRFPKSVLSATLRGSCIPLKLAVFDCTRSVVNGVPEDANDERAFGLLMALRDMYGIRCSVQGLPITNLDIL